VQIGGAGVVEDGGFGGREVEKGRRLIFFFGGPMLMAFCGMYKMMTEESG